MKNSFIKTILIGLMAATAVTFSACKKTNTPDSDVYVPPANLTQAEIRALIDDAEETRKNTKKRTIKYASDRVSDDVLKYQVKSENILDVDTKKFLTASFYSYMGQTAPLLVFYAENTDMYNYQYKIGVKISQEWFDNLFNGKDINGDDAQKYITKVTTNADKYYLLANGYDAMYYSEIGCFSHFRNRRDSIVWQVEDSMLVGSDSYNYGNNGKNTFKCKVTLDANKRYKKVEEEIMYKNDLGSSSIKGTCNFDYSTATPALPNGFSQSSFNDDKRPNQFSAKVIWGEGKGENTFWTNYYSDNLALYNISSYAPDVAGKTIAGCKIGNETYTCTQNPNGSYTWSQPNYITLTDNNTVINVIWE